MDETPRPVKYDFSSEPKPTAGCIAIAERDIIAILRWLYIN